MENQDTNLRREIDDFTDNVINKDKRYFSKLQSYDFDEEIIKYLIV